MGKSFAAIVLHGPVRRLMGWYGEIEPGAMRRGSPPNRARFGRQFVF
jgi:hypothetical protein